MRAHQALTLQLCNFEKKNAFLHTLQGRRNRLAGGQLPPLTVLPYGVKVAVLDLSQMTALTLGCGDIGHFTNKKGMEKMISQ